MNLTLHLTNKCNLSCEYCFVPRGEERMTREAAFAAVDFAVKNKSVGDGVLDVPLNQTAQNQICGLSGTPAPTKASGLLFYGGEPLLEKELIYDIVDHTKKITEKTGHIFYYKITTNGVLLDEEFLKFSRDVNMSVGFSHDGPAQNDCRKFHGGGGSFDILEEKIALLLKYQPYAIAMSVMNPETVHKAASTVKFLFDKGFRYITLNLNYGGAWTKKHLDILEREYKKMSDMYIKWTKAEEKFYLSPFELKILSHLKGEKYNEDRRLLNKEQPSVAPDGKIYAGSRYVGQPAFIIGDVFTGIDHEKQKFLYDKGSNPPEPCLDCALKTRCNYVYDSLRQIKVGDDGNRPAEITEIASHISPVQCAHEQILAPIADHAAGKLYGGRSALFIHKHYNDLYPVMSLLEDTN